MGKHFGELAKIRGLITYKLSPHEQRAYAGAISNGLPNIFRRFRESVFKWAPRKLNLILWSWDKYHYFIYLSLIGTSNANPTYAIW